MGMFHNWQHDYYDHFTVSTAYNCMTQVFNIIFNLPFMVWCDGESKMSGFEYLDSIRKNPDHLLRIENFENPYYDLA